MNKVERAHADFNRRNWKTISDTIEDKVFMKAFWDLNKLKGKSKGFIKILNRTNQFNKDYSNSGYKNEIDGIISDINKGYIYADSPNHSDDFTNYLVKESNNFILIYEKRITSNLTNDRLIYGIKKPYVDKINEENKLIINIDLISCLHHDRMSLRIHSDTDEDNWIYNPSLDELD